MQVEGWVAGGLLSEIPSTVQQNVREECGEGESAMGEGGGAIWEGGSAMCVGWGGGQAQEAVVNMPGCGGQVRW
eukprot:363538-Chlamydomonas_euryale.AAC.8